MNINQFTGLVPASFTAVGIDPETGEAVEGVINIKLNRLAFKTVTREGFSEAMENADKDPEVVGNLLAGTEDQLPLLAEWEMFTDDSNTEALPITCENIINLPYDFVTALSEAVFRKLFPAPANRENLLAGSARRGNTNSAATLNGTETQANSESDGSLTKPADITA